MLSSRDIIQQHRRILQGRSDLGNLEWRKTSLGLEVGFWSVAKASNPWRCWLRKGYDNQALGLRGVLGIHRMRD